MTRAARLIAWAVLPVAVAACGTSMTATGLDVSYAAASAHRAMLASIAPQRVQIAPVADRRVGAAGARIGVKPSGEDLLASRPAAEIVREALAVELAANGHLVVDDAPDVIFAADVEEFWLDVVPAYTHAQYVGRVALALTVSDARTGARITTRRHVGIRRQEGDEQAETQWRQVMEIALARAMRDVATDPELVSALARTTPPGRAALPTDNTSR